MKPSQFRRTVIFFSLIYFFVIFLFFVIRDPIDRSRAKVNKGTSKTPRTPSITSKNPPSFNLPPKYWKSKLSPVKDAKFSNIEKEIIRLTNDYRKSSEIIELKEDSELSNVARFHSKDMGDRKYFDHVSPDGLTPQMRKEKLYSALYGGIGENIFQVSNFQNATIEKLALLAFNSWLNSSGHRANIVNTEYTHIGVGVIEQNNTYNMTQNFAAAIVRFNQNLPDYIPVNSTLFLEGEVLVDTDKSKIKFMLAKRLPAAVKFYGLKKTNYKQIPIFWLKGRNFKADVNFDKKGKYKFLVSISNLIFDGHPLVVD